MGRTVISPFFIFHWRGLIEFIREVLSIAQFCNLGIGEIFCILDLGGMENYSSSGLWGQEEKEIRPNGAIRTFWRREKEKGCKLVESGGHQGGEGQQL